MAMPELSGWLEKTKKIKGRLVNWKKRFFKRNGSRLYYYRSDRDTIAESLGFIDLNTVLTAHPTMEADRPFAFQLNTQIRTWYLATCDEDSLMYWITGLVTLIKGYGSDQQLATPPPPVQPKATVSSRMMRALPVPKRRSELPSPTRPSQSEDMLCSVSPRDAGVGRPPSDSKRATKALPQPPAGAVPMFPAATAAAVKRGRGGLRARGRGRGGRGRGGRGSGNGGSQTTDNIDDSQGKSSHRPRSVSYEPGFSYLATEAAPEIPQEGELPDEGELDVDTVALPDVHVPIVESPSVAKAMDKPCRPPPQVPSTRCCSRSTSTELAEAEQEVTTQSLAPLSFPIPDRAPPSPRQVEEEQEQEEEQEEDPEGNEEVDQENPGNDEVSKAASAPSRAAGDRRGDWTQSVVQPKQSSSKDFLKRPSEVSLEDSHRTKLVKEVLSTEESYCASVRMMVDLYLLPLRKLDKRITSKLPAIFSNVESILQLNEEILGELSVRLEGWNDDTSLIGDVFVRYAPMLKLYSTYGNNYEDAIKVYESELGDNQFFKEAVDSCDQNSGILLHHLLIVPIQRVPRYNMLLKDILKRTAKIHPDYMNLSKAYASMQEVATHINEGVRKTERNKNFIELGSRMDISQLLAPHRELVKEAMRNCMEGGKKDKSSFQLLLFSDLFVHVPKSRLKKAGVLVKPDYNWPLTLLWVVGVEGSLLELIGPGPSRLTVMCESEEEAKGWKNAIEAATERCLASLGKKTELTDARDGSFTFENGSEYSGKWMRGMMHGTGSFAFLDNIYDGEFFENKKHGQGKLSMPLIGVYQGQFEEDSMSGGGKLIYGNGDTYVGGFLDGMRHGMGIMQYASGDSYDGMWEKGVPHGKGQMLYMTGRRYNGEWVKGMRHGRGSFDDGSGSQYDGDWAFDRRHGKGTLISKDGTYYEGEFAMDLFEGQGTLVYKYGRRYKGGFRAGRRQGRGEYTSGVGAVVQYNGEWNADVFNGKGCLTFASGNKYDGHFKDGMMHGTGVMIVLGIMVEGKWNANVLEGKATVRVGDRVIYSGTATASGIVSPGLADYPLPQLAPYFTAEL